MKKILFKIQAVNLDQFVSDTDDLATIRGGGLLLNWFPMVFTDPTHGDTRTSVAENEVISTGSSALLFCREIKDTDVPDALIHEMLAVLSRQDKDNPYQHATFVGACVELNESDFRGALREVDFRCRQRQMMCLDVPLPKQNKNLSKVFCDIDSVRPRQVESAQASNNGDTRIEGVVLADRPNAIVCNSVNVRRTYGRANKQRLLETLIGRTGTPLLRIGERTVEHSTWHFEHLTTDINCPCPGSNESRFEIPRRLAGKMAVLYLDGNSFGEMEARASRSQTNLKEWDQQLSAVRREILTEIIAWIRRDSDGWLVEVKSRKSGEEEQTELQLRIETLLWGGDDYVWVVPAWKGLEFVHRFYGAASRLSIFGRPLTFSAGMVLASHTVPIRDAVTLAARLLESAKAAKQHQGERNLLSYQVLESFDHLGEEFEELRSATRPLMLSASDAVLNESTLEMLLSVRQQLSNSHGGGLIPASRRRAIQRALHAGDLLQVERQFHRLFQVSSDISEELRTEITGLPRKWQQKCLPPKSQPHLILRDSLALWMHLFDLWNYLPRNTNNA